MTWQIVEQGAEAFSPIVDKLWDIVHNKTRSIFYYRNIDFKQLWKDKNWYNTLQVTRTRKRRKKPNRNKLRK